MKKLIAISMFSLMAALGCAGSSSHEGLSEGRFYHYHCDQNETFSAAYYPQQRSAVLQVANEEFQMKQVIMGSGTRYILDDGTAEIGNPVTLYTKGYEARLELDREIYKNCKTQ